MSFFQASVIAIFFLCPVLGCGTTSPALVPGGGGSETLAAIQKAKVLKVGYIHYPPSAYKDSSGKVSGLFVDMIEDIVRQIDPAIKIEYVETDWSDFSTDLTRTKRFDLSIAGTFTTIPRSKVVAFTDPIVYLGRSAVIRGGDKRFDLSKSPSQFDQPGIKVGVVEGEGSHEYVKKNFTHKDNIVVFSGSDLSQCLAAVSAGQVDVGMSDALETAKYCAAHPEMTDLYAATPYDLNPIAWAVRQDDLIWLNFLNNSIRLLDSSGKIAEFEKKYEFRWTHPQTRFGAGRP